MKTGEYASLVASRLGNFAPANVFTPRMLGFALTRGWVYLTFLGMASSSITLTGDAIPAYVYAISSVLLCITLFGSAILPDLFDKLAYAPGFRYVGPVSNALGTLCLMLIFVNGSESLALGIAGGALTGIGSGLIDLGYGTLYRDLPPEKTGAEVPMSYLLAAIIYTCCLLLPNTACCIIAILLPLASGAVLIFQYGLWSPAKHPAVLSVDMNLGKFSVRVGLCALLIGTADSIVRQVFMQVNGLTALEFYQFPMLVSSVVMILIVYAFQLFSFKSDFRSLYRSVMFLMALFFMLLPVFTGISFLESTLSLTAYNCFNLMIWLVLSESAYNFRLSSISTFGIGWGMVTLGVLIGQSIAQQILVLAPFSAQALSLIALIATVTILLSYMFVFKESDLIDLTAENADENADDATAQPDMETSEWARLKAEGRMPFKERCREVAAEYGLTPKETEVMILFAKGHSAARLQEDLVLSRGTITTHLNHIYRKMDVHSKAEFLQKIEDRS